MKRIWLFLVLFGISVTVQAVEVGGVRLEEDAHIGHKNLVLNGAGVRSKFFFNFYVSGLYLVAKQYSTEAVLTDKSEKRIALYMLRDMDAKSLLFAFKKSINENNSKAELREVQQQLYQFESIFIKIQQLKQGDAIFFDYRPESGMQIIVNGSERGNIAGSAFYAAMLKVWLGDKPVQKELKFQMLGGE